MTSYDDTKVQLTINRMTEECYENVPSKSSTELYLISQDPTSIAKIDLDAQSRTDAEISSIQSDLNDLSTEVSTLSEWTTTQIDDLIGDVQEVSSQTAQNAQDIADISANLTHSTVRRWEYVEYNGSDTTRGASAIPTGWTVQTF